MSQHLFEPTEEQLSVICHEGCAFIVACPGAGKTRIMTERARRLFRAMPSGRGVAFLSFTDAEVSEFEMRLREERLLPTPIFPSFVGTFDSFVWNFIVAPFGIPSCSATPRLVPDIPAIQVAPPYRNRTLPLSCFCRQTGRMIPNEARRAGFDLSNQQSSLVAAYEDAARQMRKYLCERGYLGFDDARRVALERIEESVLADTIAVAIASRFVEVFVDEAQDCNPQDLTIISWLRESGLPLKIVCDPNQSIYGFRGGVTDDIVRYAESFPDSERMDLTGNFRSSSTICKAISQLRSPSLRSTPDIALGDLASITTPIQILSYEGKVTGAIGTSYCSLLDKAQIDSASSPIVAATWASAGAAAGQPPPTNRRDRCIRLAEAVVGFRFATGFGDMKSALESVHRVLLEIEGRLRGVSYHQYIADNEMVAACWRPKVISIVQALDPFKDLDAKTWHTAAKELLSRELTIEGGGSISQRFRWNDQLHTALAVGPKRVATPRTIHAVKGMEFPGICVVTTRATLRRTLDFLEEGAPDNMAEEARKLYVAASRAQRLLAIAAPKSQARRLGKHLIGRGAPVTILSVGAA